MAFVFTLKTLLRLRELREASELRSLRSLAAEVLAVRAEIEALETAGEEQQRGVCRDSLQGISGADLHMHLRRQTLVRERRELLAQKLKELEKAREAQQDIYMGVRQEREALSTLREQHLAAYEEEQSRREQRQIDDLFLVRYVREQNAAKIR
jgi:flagellar export protein FliJ